MKRFLSFLLFTSSLVAQIQEECIEPTYPSLPCCNGYVNTDPNYLNDVDYAPIDFNYNPNWLSGYTFPAYKSASELFYLPHPYKITTITDLESITNWTPSTDRFDTLVYSPRFGWELIHYNFNTQINTSTPLFESDPNNRSDAGFDMMFYNKYTGQLRLFMYPLPFADENYSKLSSEIRFIDINETSPSGIPRKYSGLFNNYQYPIKALDKNIEVLKIKSFAPNFQTFHTRPVWYDFETSYDPCVCIFDNHQTELEFNFYTSTIGQMYLEGNAFGFSKSINSSGGDQTLFGTDYLASVYTDYLNDINFDVENGFSIYQDLNSMIENGYIPEWQEGLLDLLDLAQLGVDNVPWPDLNIAGINVPYEQALSYGFKYFSNQINSKRPTFTITESKMALRGEFSSTFGSRMKSSFRLYNPGSQYTVNQFDYPSRHPLYNEALGVFSLMKTPKLKWGFNSSKNTSFTWAGNLLHSITSQDFNKTNEGLAFAIEEPIQYVINPASGLDLEKSEIYANIEFEIVSYSNMELAQICISDTDGVNSLAHPNEFPFFFENIPLYMTFMQPRMKYFDSPFMGIDIDRTEDYFECIDNAVGVFLPCYYRYKKHNLEESTRYKYGPDILAPSFINIDVDTQYINGNERIKYIHHFATPIVPIDKIHEFKFVEFFNDLRNKAPLYDNSIEEVNPVLKIVAHLQFKPNNYGEVNNVEKVFTYDLDKIKIPIVDFDNCTKQPLLCNKLNYANYVYPDTIIINSTNYTSSQTITADVIIIDGNLNTIGSSNVIINGATNVIVTNESIINGNITIVSENVFMDDNGRLDPVPTNLVAAFCKSNAYKADQAKSSEVSNPEINHGDTIIVINDIKMLVYPNPTYDVIHIGIDGWKENGKLVLYDLSGRLIYQRPIYNENDAMYFDKIDLSNFADGTYILVFENAEKNISNKVIKISNNGNRN